MRTVVFFPTRSSYFFVGAWFSRKTTSCASMNFPAAGPELKIAEFPTRAHVLNDDDEEEEEEEEEVLLLLLPLLLVLLALFIIFVTLLALSGNSSILNFESSLAVFRCTNQSSFVDFLSQDNPNSVAFASNTLSWKHSGANDPNGFPRLIAFNGTPPLPIFAHSLSRHFFPLASCCLSTNAAEAECS